MWQEVTVLSSGRAHSLQRALLEPALVLVIDDLYASVKSPKVSMHANTALGKPIKVTGKSY